MAIKDLLSKVSKPGDPKDPKVQQLREKLQKLQQKGKGPAKKGTPTTKTVAKKAAPLKKGTRPDDKAIAALADAPELQQRQAVQFDHPELKLKEERTHKLIAKQIGEVIQLATDLNKRVSDIEKERQKSKQEVERIERQNKDIQEKMNIIDQRLEKFMGLYEVITNQYNPFAENAVTADQPVPPAAPNPIMPQGNQVQVNDSITGQQEHVPIEQGNISEGNQEKIQKLLAELEQQEQEKVKATEEEVEAINTKEEEVKADVVSELHNMFEQFEKRLSQRVDDSVQEKLHDILSGLETTMVEEVDQALDEKVEDLRQNEQHIADALAEIEQLSEQATEKEPYVQEAQAVQQEIQSVDDHIKAIPPSMYFRLHDGRVLKSKQDLILALQTMPEQVFQMHVHQDRNDFADWLEMALQDSIGKDLRGKTREQMAHVLSQ